ncbi:MAG TPA: serine/threonine-protein kinase [Oculatellaceae cyanobacterium]
MSESLNRETTDPDQEPTLCPKCQKPLAKDLKFTVSSWFQTDPGSGLSRWQQCCKCALTEAQDDDLPFNSEVRAAAQEEEQSLSQPIMVSLQPVNQSPIAAAETVVKAQTVASESSANDVAQSHESKSAEEPTAISPWALGYANLPNIQTAQVKPHQPQPEGVVKVETESNPSSTAVESNHSSVNPETQADVPKPFQTFLPAEIGAEFLPQETRINSPDPTISQSYLIGGRYEVDSVIGKGTFGPTYRARDGATGRMMCLKLVSTPISRHRRIVKRIIQEVEKSKALNHPHIVAIYDSAMDKSGRPFYVMDLIEGGSLKKAIKEEGFLDVSEVLDIFLDVCEALSYAHEHGVLHRDLKPGNILLTGQLGQRRAKVADFGVMKSLPSLGSEAQAMTQSTDVFADPSCMSPEQCLGRRLDVRSDIYSLGCSMYEAIVGKRVFTGPNPLSIVVQHFKVAPRPFDAVMYNCDIHEDVEAVVMRMIEKTPENRYQEISQVIEDLRLLKAHRKPNFAYQKKKAPKSLMPFSNKEEQNDAERLFDMVLQSQKSWESKDRQNAKPQVETDIERLARKGDANARRQRMVVVKEQTELERDQKWVRQPNTTKPTEEQPFVPAPAPQSDPSAGAPQRVNKAYEVIEIPNSEEISLLEVSAPRPIITADQAKREIPEYLLEIAQNPFLFWENWTPLMIATATMLAVAILMTLWLVVR